jgi:hypothetical protein
VQYSPFDADLRVVGKGMSTGVGKDLPTLIGRAQKTATSNAQRHAFAQLAIFLSDTRPPTLFQLPGTELRSAFYRQCVQDALARAMPTMCAVPIPQRGVRSRRRAPKYHYHRHGDGNIVTPSPIGVVPPSQARLDLLTLEQQQQQQQQVATQPGHSAYDQHSASEFRSEFIEVEHSEFDVDQEEPHLAVEGDCPVPSS